MTNKQLYIKEFGKEAYERLDKKLKKLFERIDSISLSLNGGKPFSHRELQEAVK